MIIYKGGLLGLSSLGRIHGSATYKAVLPALVSTGILLALDLTVDPTTDIEDRWFAHPYPIATMIAAFTFLLTFKCSFSYNRYWEACTAVHQMHSKWMDVGMEIAAFHLQSKRYEEIKPPSFGDYSKVSSILRKRRRLKEKSTDQLIATIEESVSSKGGGGSPLKSPLQKVFSTRGRKSQKLSKHGDHDQDIDFPLGRGERLIKLTSSASLHGGMNVNGKEERSLFLQEAAHLLSLSSAVAFTTLRNDIEGVEPPLREFQRDDAWPPVDPDSSHPNLDHNYYEMPKCIKTLAFLLGFTRTPAQRTVYNSLRPFSVIGGVSDAEVELIRNARGAFAKTALCTMWLQEFISREFLCGSFGNVSPPIVSRLFQYISDGMLGYNQARKVAYIPFPFVHNQLTAFFVMTVVGCMPVLMLCFVNSLIAAIIMNFLSVTVFVGLHEVARELEDPFRNVPNDIPLNNFQAQFNEALMSMYKGYHPEAWWEIQGPAEGIHTSPIKTPKTSSSAGPLRTLIDESDHSLNLK